MSESTPTPDTAAPDAGLVKCSPIAGDLAVKCDIVNPAYPWYSIIHSVRMSEADVADWAVIGTVPGSPAARSVAGTPTPDASALRDACEEYCETYNAVGWDDIGNEDEGVVLEAAASKIRAALAGLDPYNPPAGSGTAALTAGVVAHALSYQRGYEAAMNALTTQVAAVRRIVARYPDTGETKQILAVLDGGDGGE